MNIISKARAVKWVIALAFVFSAVSCVKEEYEISEDTLNMEVEVFGEGVEIPIGSTEALKLKSLLSKLDSTTLEYLKTGSNGDLSLGLSDSFDLSDKLGDFTNLIEIPDLDFSKSFSFNLSGMDVSNLEVKADKYEMSYDLGTMLGAPSITVPSISETLKYNAGLEEYYPDLSSFSFNLPAIKQAKEIGKVTGASNIPSSLISDTEIPLDPAIGGSLAGGVVSIKPLTTTFKADPITMKMKIRLPEGVTSVQEINFCEDARVTMNLSLTNSFFKKGTITPTIDIDLHEIFHLADEENAGHPDKVDHIVAAIGLNAAGGSTTKTFKVASVAQEASDWNMVDGCLQLEKNVTVTLQGALAYSDLATTTRILSGATEPMGISLDVQFADFTVGEVKMTLDSQEPVTINESSTFPIEVPAITLPEGVKNVQYIEFTDNSSISIHIGTENVLKGIQLGLDALEITFPKEFEVAGATDGKLTYSIPDLVASGLDSEIKIRRFNLPAPVDGVISYSGNVEVKAVASATVAGSISTKDLPSSADEDMAVTVGISSTMEIKDYSVVLDGYDYEVDQNESISAELPDLKEVGGSVVVYPEGNPVISISITLPETSVPVKATKGGLIISLPEMLRFKDNEITKYGYDKSSHAIIFAEGAAIPAEILLPLDYISVAPVLDESNGKYYINGEFKVKGSIGIASGTEIHKSDIDKLTGADAKVGIVIDIPRITPGSVGIESYSTTVSQEFEFELLKGNQIPDMIKSVEEVKLKDVFINLALDASSLPSLGDASLTFDFSVDLPKMIVLEEGKRNEAGILKLTGKADKDGMIKVEPIKVVAIDLSDVDLKSGNGISEKISINGSVDLSKADLDVDQWLGKEMEVSFQAGIKDIVIESVAGKVDFSIDPVESSVNLSGISTSLSTDNISTTLDVSHVHLMLDVATNLGISANANLELIPFHGAAASEPIVVSLTLDAPETPGVVKTTKFWLGEKQECCPAGYTFRQAPILSLIRDLPDSIQIRLGAGTDAAKLCHLSPSAEPVLRADYALDIPLALGEQFSIEYRDTIPDIPEIVSTIFQYGNLTLSGTVESSLPFNLNMTAKLLDKDYKVITLADDAGKQFIAGCGADGSATKTDLAIKMAKKQGVEIPTIAAVELVLNATPTAGVALNEESFIKIALQALVPDGVTLDLSEYVFPEENEKEGK